VEHAYGGVASETWRSIIAGQLNLSRSLLDSLGPPSVGITAFGPRNADTDALRTASRLCGVDVNRTESALECRFWSGRLFSWDRAQ
jgi:hypothetical protein